MSKKSVDTGHRTGVYYAALIHRRPEDVMVDPQLAEIQQRIEDGYVTDDDILHLYKRAKVAHAFEVQYNEAKEQYFDALKEILRKEAECKDAKSEYTSLLDEFLELQGLIEQLKAQVTELEAHVFNAN